MAVYNFDKQWKFHLGDFEDTGVHTHTECYMAAKAGGAIGAASVDTSADDWETVDLPHDWAVYGEFDPKYGPAQGYKPRGKGWYKKLFRLDESDREKELYLQFDGVASHATVWINGSVAGRNFGGYNSFIVNITDMALYGDALNDVTVFADASPIEGWWYEGAGIYRHVKLIKKEKVHIIPWGVYVHPKKISADIWDTLTDVTVKNAAYEPKTCRVKAYIINPENNTVGKDEKEITLAPCEERVVKLSLLTYSPLLWDIDSPNMYSLATEIYDGERLLNRDITRFGYRTISVSADDGFFLNGRRVNLYGTCNHQDHAGVGVAVPDKINEYRIRLLKELGSNAYRCAHGNPSPEILDFCDKYGLLVMDENRNFNSSPDGIAQVTSMVLRDRNHPSVVMYSIFNEEPLQGTPTGRKLALRLQSVIKSLDPDRFTVGAMNTGVTADGGACDALDMTGFNYITRTYDDFREKYPHMPMLGSENDSAFQTRGVYKTDHGAHVIDCYDSEAAPWGNTYRDGFKQVAERPHILGLFIWTGFDYRGEPTPFEWPSVSTQFGIMDTCGFKKDAFWLNKAFFTEEPFMHVLPHWNFDAGENVKVMVCTSCPEAEVFINGVSCGRKSVDRYDMAEWSVVFEAGELKAVGYKDGAEYTDIQKTAGAIAALELEAPFETVDPSDGFPINVKAADADGTFVPCADELVRFSVTGGTVIGVGNGDPNSHEADKAQERRLFNGLCQCIVQAGEDCGYVTVTAETDSGIRAEITVNVHDSGTALPVIESVSGKYISSWRQTVELSAEMPDVTVKIADHDMNTWGITAVGNGADALCEGKEGYMHYKTLLNVPEGKSDARLIFKEIRGDKVWVYINGVLAAEEDNVQPGSPFEADVPEGDITADVVIFTEKDSSGGITRPVILV